MPGKGEEIRGIASAAEMACIIEASCEKPGNVTPTHSFADASYRDFLLGSSAIRPSIEAAAERGFLAGRGRIGLSEIGVGALVNEGVKDVKRAHGGGNTHLGILMLFVPVASAAGCCIAKRKGFKDLRKTVSEVVSSSTKQDARSLYSAIKIAGAGGLGRLKEVDASFHDLMRISAERDGIARELSGGMDVTFGLGLPAYERYYAASGDIGDALIKTYLLILSKHPDTLIAKKAGKKEAEQVSALAAKTLKGELSLKHLDSSLREKGNLLNPGTTADLACCVLLLWLLRKKMN